MIILLAVITLIACSNESRVPNNSPSIAAKLAQGGTFPPCELPIAADEEDNALINITCTLDNSWPTSAVHSQDSRGFYWGANNRTLVVVGTPEDDNVVQGSWHIMLSLPGDGTIAAKSDTLVKVVDDDLETVAVEFLPQVVREAKPAQAKWDVDVYYNNPRIFLGTQTIIITPTHPLHIRKSSGGSLEFRDDRTTNWFNQYQSLLDSTGAYKLSSFINGYLNNAYGTTAVVQGTDYSDVEYTKLFFEHTDIPSRSSDAVEASVRHGEIVIRGGREVVGGVFLNLELEPPVLSVAGSPAFISAGTPSSIYPLLLRGSQGIARVVIKSSLGGGNPILSDNPYSCNGDGSVSVIIESSRNNLFDRISLRQAGAQVPVIVSTEVEHKATFDICP